jgi:bacteriocin-like protein
MPEEKKEKSQLVDIEDIEISTLDDKELESVSGGVEDATYNTAVSCQHCNVAPPAN